MNFSFFIQPHPINTSSLTISNRSTPKLFYINYFNTFS